jgi:iron(III) transport system permease protein
MILISALNIVPMIYIMISGVFARVDPSFEEAGRTSGAKTWATIRRISMPLLGPAIFAAVIYYLVRTIETFEIPAMLGIPKGIFVFSSAIYYATHTTTGLPNYGISSTYSMVLMVTAGILIYFYSRYIKRAERFATVTGRGYRPRLIDLGKWKFVPVILMAGYFVLAVVMPLIILLWTSIGPPFRSISLSAMKLINLDAYYRLLDYPYVYTAAINTLIISVTAAALSMLIVTVISWLSVRGGIRGSWIPERLSFMIICVPGIVIGLVLIFLYAAVPIPLYGSIWIIVLALVTMSLPFGTRLMTAAFLQIHRELEEAAGTSGVGMGTTFFRIVLPLLWPSFARGYLSMFVHSMRDTTIALMLYTVGNQTIAVTLWNLWVEEAEFALASAIAVPMMIVTIALTYFVAKQTMLTGGNV